MYTIDASVFVRSYSVHDEEHKVCHQLLNSLKQQNIPLFEPTLVLFEIAGAISRGLRNPIMGRIYAENLLDLSHITFVPLDFDFARNGLAIAADYRLHGADAVYAAVALRYGTTLISLDRDHQKRIAHILPTLTPATILENLQSGLS